MSRYEVLVILILILLLMGLTVASFRNSMEVCVAAVAEDK